MAERDDSFAASITHFEFGDEEWMEFNISDDDKPVESALLRQELHETKTQSKAIQLQYQDAQRHILLLQKELQSRPKSSTNKVEDDEEKRRSKSNNSSNREKSKGSKQSSASSSPWKCTVDKMRKPSLLSGFFLDTEDDEDGVPGHESSSVSTPSTSEEFQGHSWHSWGAMSPRESSRAPVDPAKPKYAPHLPIGSNHLPKGSIREESERSKQTSSSPSKSTRDETTKPSSSRRLLDTEDDEDGVSGHESSSVSTPSVFEEFQGHSRQRGPMSPRVSSRAAVDSAKAKDAHRRPSGSNRLPRGSIREKSERSKLSPSSSSSSSSYPSKSTSDKTTKPSLLCGGGSRELLNGSHRSLRVDSPSTRDWNLEKGAPRTSNRPRRMSAPSRPIGGSNRLPSGSIREKSERSKQSTSSSSPSLMRGVSLRDSLNGSNRSSRVDSPSTRDCWDLEGVPRSPHQPLRADSTDALASSCRKSARKMLFSPRKELVRRKDGSVHPRQPKDCASRAAQSKTRRESVEASLFLFLHDDVSPAVPDTTAPRRGHARSLQGSMHHQDSHRSMGSTGMRSAGAQSAPPSMGPSPLTPSLRDVKSRLLNKIMISSPSPKKQVTAVREGSQMAQEGYIAIIDGKMRLVSDCPDQLIEKLAQKNKLPTVSL